MKSKNKSIFFSHKDFPSELNYAQSRFSVDVLVWNKKTEEHTIGWFDFQLMKWCFLCREVQGSFKWRYLSENIDKP